ncbi:hypothetical protein [uncultured Mediterranean phage uvMED]|nr:hypothetical protein [uncultured Mediterranean phage uvMED]
MTTRNITFSDGVSSSVNPASTTITNVGVGSKWHHGTGTPAGSVGNDNDYYLDISNGDVYGPKTNGAWASSIGSIKGATGTAGTNGTDGKGITSIAYTSSTDLVDTYTITYSDNTTSTFTVTNGAEWRSGDGVPANTLGKNGDYYLDVESGGSGEGNIYQKASGAYSVKMNIKAVNIIIENQGLAGSGTSASPLVLSLDGSSLSKSTSGLKVSTSITDKLDKYSNPVSTDSGKVNVADSTGSMALTNLTKSNVALSYMPDNFDNSIGYSSGTIVFFQGVNYKAKQMIADPSPGALDNPDVDTVNWESLGGGAGGISDPNTLKLFQSETMSIAYDSSWYNAGDVAIQGRHLTWGAGSANLTTSNMLSLSTISGDLIDSTGTKVLKLADTTTRASYNTQPYFGWKFDLERGYRGRNLVANFQYRTSETSGTTSNSDWLFIARDGSKPIMTLTSATTSTNTITGTQDSPLLKDGATSAYTAPVVGDTIMLTDTSGQSSEIRYITAINSGGTAAGGAIEFSISGDAVTIASGEKVVIGILTDLTSFLPPTNDNTNKVAKNYSNAFLTPETCQVIEFGVSNRTLTEEDQEIFIDNIMLSANKFLQASSQTKSEFYFCQGDKSNFWDTGTGNAFQFDEALISPMVGTPPLADSKYLTIGDATGPGAVGTISRIMAKENLNLTITITKYNAAGSGLNIYDSSERVIAIQQQPDGATFSNYVSTSARIKLAKDDFIYCLGQAGGTNGRIGGISIVAEPIDSDVIILESQDEIFTDWQEYTPTFLNSPGISNIQAFFRRNGPNLEIRGRVQFGTMPAATMALSLPSGHSIDIQRLGGKGADDVYFQSRFLRVENTIDFNSSSSNSCGLFFDKSQATKTTNLFVGFNYSGKSGDCIDSVDYNSFGGTGDGAEFYASGIPISGFNANFNPLLSMPLVDIGSNVEQYLVNTWAGRAGNSIYSTGTPTVNTLSGLGTVTNSSTEGFFFTASQRCKVNFSYFMMSTGTPDIGLAGGSSTLDFYNNNFHSSHFNGFRLDAQAAQTATGYDGASSEILLEPGQKIGIAFSDSTSGITSGANNGAAMIVATKDFSNTTMAHIIKPAVVVLSEEDTSYGIWGGDLGAVNTWHTRTLNTVRGDSWFVTLNDSTDTFTLEAGTYKAMGQAPLYAGNQHKARLYNSSDGVAVINGQNSYSNASYNGQAGGFFMGTFNITSSKDFKVQHIFNNDNGGISQGGFDSGGTNSGPSVFTTIMIEKLK